MDTRDEQVKVTDSQIDVAMKAFQGLTVSCARCHDHKFDAISQRDYYALAGIFESSRPAMVTIDPRRNCSRKNKTELAASSSCKRSARRFSSRGRTSRHHIATRLLAEIDPDPRVAKPPRKRVRSA